MLFSKERIQQQWGENDYEHQALEVYPRRFVLQYYESTFAFLQPHACQHLKGGAFTAWYYLVQSNAPPPLPPPLPHPQKKTYTIFNNVSNLVFVFIVL